MRGVRLSYWQMWDDEKSGRRCIRVKDHMEKVWEHSGWVSEDILRLEIEAMMNSFYGEELEISWPARRLYVP